MLGGYLISGKFDRNYEAYCYPMFGLHLVSKNTHQIKIINPTYNGREHFKNYKPMSCICDPLSLALFFSNFKTFIT